MVKNLSINVFPNPINHTTFLYNASSVDFTILKYWNKSEEKSCVVDYFNEPVGDPACVFKQ